MMVGERMRVRADLTPVLYGLGVAATVLSRFELLSALLLIAALAVASLRLLRVERTSSVGVAMLLFVAVRLLWGAAVGALPPFGNFAAWRSFFAGEGRELVAFVILAALCSPARSHDTVARCERYVRWAAYALAVSLVLWRLGLLDAGARNFRGTTSSHHVAGLLAASALLITLGRARGTRALGSMVLSGLLLVAVVASGSRTALVALLAVAAYALITRRTIRGRVRIIGSCVIFLCGALVMSQRVQATVDQVVSGDLFGGQEVGTAVVRDGRRELYLDSDSNEAQANILKRFGAWRAAMSDFSSSPLVGVGSWRLNDVELERHGLPGLLAFRTGEPVPSGLSAHNTLLQLAAENGILGVAAFSAVWISLWRRTRAVTRPRRVRERSRMLLVLGFGTVVGSNALLSPALLLPAIGYVVIVAHSPRSRRAEVALVPERRHAP